MGYIYYWRPRECVYYSFKVLYLCPRLYLYLYPILINYIYIDIDIDILIYIFIWLQIQDYVKWLAFLHMLFISAYSFQVWVFAD